MLTRLFMDNHLPKVSFILLLLILIVVNRGSLVCKGINTSQGWVTFPPDKMGYKQFLIKGPMLTN